MAIATKSILSREGLAELLRQLRADGRTLLGPREREGAITYDEIQGIEDLPEGLQDSQAAGSYHLEPAAEPTLFGFSATAQSFKRFFHPPRQRLFNLRRGPKGPELLPGPSEARPLALIGARGCDVAGLATLDGVLADGGTAEPSYVERRQDVFVVAIHCTVAGGTCFCSPMGTGPRTRENFDIALTELPGAPQAGFLAEGGTARGRLLLDRVTTRRATVAEDQLAEQRVQAVSDLISSRVDLAGSRELLKEHLEGPSWQRVAERCLACGACTMVCPTCFCSNTEESKGWDEEVSRDRVWDSCFTGDFSYIHGGSVRASTQARYRQWLTHKFSSWFDQFGQAGCVGCGRCVTWCPVGIDLVEELSNLKKEAKAMKGTE